jgi:cyclohexanone monooxygenase
VSCEPTQTPDEIDLDALTRKYRQERDRRLRSDGAGQFAEAKGEFAEVWEADPYSPPVERAPIVEDVEVAILGGGMAGLIAGVRLKEAGVSSLRIIEMAGDFGGVWYWNRYPGVQCDGESYCYLPLLEELNYIPSAKFADGAEIGEHLRNVGRHYGLYEHALFGTQVRGLRWDAGARRWRIDTRLGDDIRARFVVMACGPINRPKLPGIPGITSFAGHSFHTSRWDYAYTGGDATGGLDRLGDKRVAIIGTGATAIQAVPFLGQYAKHLYVFQRTPSAIHERGNSPTDPEWARSLKPGWQKARQANYAAFAFDPFPPGPQTPDLVCDGWTEINRNTAARLAALGHPDLTPQARAELRSLEEFRVMERLRERVDEIVEDKATAETLKAWYRFGCKRPCFNDEYLPTFNRPNVTLVDVSKSKGVERITETAVVADGVAYEVDCIIYASGFEISTELSRRLGIEAIEGRDGLSLYDHWADGFRTLHGMTSHGFPNQFFTGFTQAAPTQSISEMYEQQVQHIVYIIKEAIARGASSVEPSLEAQEEWVRIIRENALPVEIFLRECTPSYFNNEGAEVIRSPAGEPYGPGFYALDSLLAAWRAKGDLNGLVLGG